MPGVLLQIAGSFEPRMRVALLLFGSQMAPPRTERIAGSSSLGPNERFALIAMIRSLSGTHLKHVDQLMKDTVYLYT